MIPDPDAVRIRESYQIKCECIRIRILESGFQESGLVSCSYINPVVNIGIVS